MIRVIRSRFHAIDIFGMAMFRKILCIACIAGIVTGLLLTVIQLLEVTPLIVAAETYESRTEAVQSDRLSLQKSSGADYSPDSANHPHASGYVHSHGAWKPSKPLIRAFWTAVANIGTSFGFALLIVAILAWRGRADWLQGLLWGTAGFVVFFLNPSLGIPPEIPGTDTIALVDRQLWWMGSVAVSALAIAVLILTKSWLTKGGGMVLLLVPYLIGSPHPGGYSGSAPAELAQSFVTAVTITNAVYWLALGLISAITYQYIVRVR